MHRVYVHACKSLLEGRWAFLSSCIIGRSWNFVQVLMPTTLGRRGLDFLVGLHDLKNDRLVRELAGVVTAARVDRSDAAQDRVGVSGDGLE